MVGRRRGPGRPPLGSREKLVTAACALLAERGYTAMSPQMVIDRSKIGHGSLYHHFQGKSDLTIAAISQLRERSVAYLDASTDAAGPEAVEDAVATTQKALARLFQRPEGHALIRLFADPTAGADQALAEALNLWWDELQTATIRGLRGDKPGDDPALAAQAAAFLAPEFNASADGILTAALGHGLRNLLTVRKVT